MENLTAKREGKKKKIGIKKAQGRFEPRPVSAVLALSERFRCTVLVVGYFYLHCYPRRSSEPITPSQPCSVS